MLRDVGVKIRDRRAEGKGVDVRVTKNGERTEKHYSGADALEKAERMAEEIREAQRLEGFWESLEGGDPLPIDEVLNNWLLNDQGFRKPRTREANTTRVKWLVEWFGARDLRELDGDALTAFATHMTDELGRAGWSAAGALSTLRIVYRRALKKGLFAPKEEAPFAEVIRGVKAHTSEGATTRDALTREEAATLLDVAREKDRDVWAALLFLLYTGARRGEMLALKWDVVDIFSRRARIVRVPRGDVLGETKEPKTKQSKRAIPLHPLVVEMLEAQRRRRVPIPDWVFPAPQGGAWDEHGFDKRWRKVRASAALKGVRGLPLHCLRHTFISWALERGVPAKRVAEWVGASVLTIESHYAHVMPLRDDSMSFLDAPPKSSPEKWGKVGEEGP